jgi:hypothetical protein
MEENTIQKFFGVSLAKLAKETSELGLPIVLEKIFHNLESNISQGTPFYFSTNALKRKGL